MLKAFGDEETSLVKPNENCNMQTLTFEGFKLFVWDIDSQGASESSLSAFSQGTDALIFVVDSADKKKLAESGAELQRLLKVN